MTIYFRNCEGEGLLWCSEEDHVPNVGHDIVCSLDNDDAFCTRYTVQCVDWVRRVINVRREVFAVVWLKISHDVAQTLVDSWRN